MTVEEFCNLHIPKAYHNWYMGYGDHSRTDVKKWILEVMVEPDYWIELLGDK